MDQWKKAKHVSQNHESVGKEFVEGVKAPINTFSSSNKTTLSP